MGRSWSLLILVVLMSATVYMQGTGHTAADCCLQTSNKRIPFSVVVGYKIQTAYRGCPIPAVVFSTNTKPPTNLCSTPGMPWVNRLIKKLEKMKRDDGKKDKIDGRARKAK
ncbi:C-C motif chemokine 21a-like isoform X2 [Pseudophryne corroboree]|uniref:C-C motif chemokine 21a-like isoform X2 n=1 Tax=Pseudophryne corroboree TaxID=495146 RepID=UPI003081B967